MDFKIILIKIHIHSNETGGVVDTNPYVWVVIFYKAQDDMHAPAAL